MSRIRVGIIGGAGYTGGELIRILLHHPEVELKFVHSASNRGNPFYAVHKDLIGETEMTFTEEFSDADIDVLFLCSLSLEISFEIDKQLFWQLVYGHDLQYLLCLPLLSHHASVSVAQEQQQHAHCEHHVHRVDNLIVEQQLVVMFLRNLNAPFLQVSQPVVHDVLQRLHQFQVRRVQEKILKEI